MSRKVGSLLALATMSLGLSAAAPTSAADWTVECVWERVPLTDRKAFLDSSPQDRRRATNAIALADLGPAFRACNAPDDQASSLHFMVYMARNIGLEELKKEYGLKPDAILDAWTSIPAADRIKAGQIALRMDYSDDARAALVSLATQMKQKLGNSDRRLEGIASSLTILEAKGHGGLSHAY